MKTKEIKLNFGFTAFLWHDIGDKSGLFSDAKDYIKANYKVSDYTTSPKIKAIYFSLLINTPETESFFEFKSRYGAKSGIINIHGKIPYETFKEADDKTAMRLMCESYLAAILLIPTFRGMKNKNFDAQRLHDDLKKVFVEKGWV